MTKYERVLSYNDPVKGVPTRIALFRSNTTKYPPVAPYIEPVPPSTKYCPIMAHCHQAQTNKSLYKHSLPPSIAQQCVTLYHHMITMASTDQDLHGNPPLLTWFFQGWLNIDRSTTNARKDCLAITTSWSSTKVPTDSTHY